MFFVALLAVPGLFYLPGWALCRAVGPAITIDLLERHYERVVISMLLNGWLALLLAEVGYFSLGLHLLLLLLFSGALLAWFWQRGRPPGQSDGVAQRSELIAFALVGVLALLLVIRPFETILGGRDAGVYANTGFAIARTGSLVQHDELVAEFGQAAQASAEALRAPAEQALTNFLGVQNPQRYIATRLRAAGFFINAGEAAEGRVVPQFLHLFPAWIALLTSLLGRYGGLFAPGLMGLVGAWSVGMLGRRLAGSHVGLLAFLLLALNSVQVWFSRYSTSETTAQFLTFAGLYCFARFQQSDVGADHNHRRGTIFYAALAGIAFGQLLLTRIDFFLVIGPLLFYLLYCLLTRRWYAGQTALALGLGAMGVHAALHIIFIARAYFFDTGFDRLQDYALTTYLALPFFTSTLREVIHANAENALNAGGLLPEVLFLLLGLALLLLGRRWPAPLRRGEALLRRWRPLLLGSSALGIVLLAGYAYLVRPQIIDSDILLNTRGGWNDPLRRDPRMVQMDVNAWRMSPDVARSQAGVVLVGDPEYAATAIDAAATAELRAQLRAARGPWAGPFSNQSFNWMRLQGYVGATIALPRVFYDDGKEWWREYAENVPPGVEPPTGLPVREKELIPLANFVRVGWYLSPLGVTLGVLGFALWWWRGMSRAAWLFLTVGLLGTFFYVRQTYGTSDQTYIYILRRFVAFTYPAFSLGMAYALVALASWPRGNRHAPRATRRAQPRNMLAVLSSQFWIFCSGFSVLLLTAFFIWTGRHVYTHTEYAGALPQLATFAERFDDDDILLFRGGGPVYSMARDVPDIVVTPLHFAFNRDAFTVKSTHPGAYADLLAAQVRAWQMSGREVYLILSASGGEFTLPGFMLQPAGTFLLDVPEFEQLTDQKPRNVATLRLPFTIYRLVEGVPGQLTTLPTPLTATDFAAQVQGLYLPEADQSRPAATAEGSYAWTNGAALFRLPWPRQPGPQQVELRAAGGERPAQLGPAQVCLTLLPESAPWPLAEEEGVSLGCQILSADASTYRVTIDSAHLPPPATGSMLLRLESSAWVPAATDPRRHDPRPVGIQFWGLNIGYANTHR